MSYNITALGDVYWPQLDGQGSLYGMFDVAEKLGQPCKWDGQRWVLIDGLPRCARIAVNGRGDIAFDRDDHNSALFTDGRTIELGRISPLRLNDRLQVLGRDADNRGVVWQDGELTLLPDGLDVSDMNNHGLIAGDLELDPDNSVAALWHSGELTEIRVEGLPLLSAVAVNDNGQVLVKGYIYDEAGEPLTTVQGLWQDGQYTPIPAPYSGDFFDGYLNGKGDVLAYYWIDVGPPYVYEESVFLWKNGLSADVHGLVNGHLGFSSCAGIDDSGQLLVSDKGQFYLLSPGTAASPRGPMRRPDVPARFVLFREPANTRSLRRVGLPGATRLHYYFDKLFGRGNAEAAFDPAKVRIGEREHDPLIVVDDTGITTPTYGYMPWSWIEHVLAIDLEGHFGLSIHLNRSPEWHNRFPDSKAFILWLGKDLTGGPVENGACLPTPLKVLYPKIEAFVRQFVPKKVLP